MLSACPEDNATISAARNSFPFLSYGDYVYYRQKKHDRPYNNLRLAS